MLSRAKFAVCLVACLAAAESQPPAAYMPGASPTWTVLASDAGSWPEILSAIGLQRAAPAKARIIVTGPGAAASADFAARVDQGAILILEGASPLAELFGIRPGATTVRVNSLTDIHRPALPIVWESGIDVPVFELPPAAEIFAKERWTGAPLIAGFRRGSGAVFWIAASPGPHGYERFPYILQALVRLGVEPPFRSSRLWAFFDSSYRLRVDVDYFAARWRQSGIAALHVAAWHYYEPDAERDAWLAKLIEACHREGILVYAWLELPHVSEKFWTDHPEWREKTAILQDAHLDWRKLMNLTNRDCFRTVSNGIGALAQRFDWDGINLAELYFESLEGIANPSRFTPLNDDVRAEFRTRAGFDPIELFSNRPDAASRRRFLDYRAEIGFRMQQEWLAFLETVRSRKPYLDLVLTHVDDRFDRGMRDAIGADAANVLPLLDRHDMTFMVEDPATIWNLGAQRYHTIAERYRALTPHFAKLAIDLNVVDRYQNVYPTKQQTGVELFQLVHSAAANFPRVALYFENSLLPPDLNLLPAAAAAAVRLEGPGSQILVDSVSGVGLPWRGPAQVDGRAWPVADDQTVWLPAGLHTVSPGLVSPGLHLVRLNAELKSARLVSSAGIEFEYESGSRAIALLDRIPARLSIDGIDQPLRQPLTPALFLPRGTHRVSVASD